MCGGDGVEGKVENREHKVLVGWNGTEERLLKNRSEGELSGRERMECGGEKKGSTGRWS